MSTLIMSRCWRLQMPPTAKSVLISLADNANDEGHCWPSIPTIAKRTCFSERAIHGAIKWLEENGLVKADRSDGRHTSYLVTPDKYIQPPQEMQWLATTNHRSKCGSITAGDAVVSSCRPPQQMQPPAQELQIPPQQMQSPPQEMRSNRKELSKNRQGTVNKGESAKFDPISELLNREVPPQAAEDWLKIRKAKGAPLTKTALDGLIREAGKAGIHLSDAVRLCAERGWQSLRAEWLQNSRTSARSSDEQRRAENEEAYRLAFGTNPSEVIDA